MCGAHGVAKNGTCVCETGFTGSRCLSKACPGDGQCSGNGGCSNGTCVCKDGFTGPECAKKALAPQRPYQCSVHCVRKCLRVSQDAFTTKGLAASREIYNNCTKDCAATCLRASSDEHQRAVKLEENHPNAVEIPESFLPTPPPSISMIPVGVPSNGQAPEAGTSDTPAAF